MNDQYRYGKALKKKSKILFRKLKKKHNSINDNDK